MEPNENSRFVDFTNATAFEQFVCDVESSLRLWQEKETNSIDVKLITYEGQDMKNSASRDDCVFTLRYVKWGEGNVDYLDSMMENGQNAFCGIMGNSFVDCTKFGAPKLILPPVHSWFGVKDYVLLTRLEETSNYLGSVKINQTNMLVSALSIALQNCNWTLPAFVVVEEPSTMALKGVAMPGEELQVLMRFETNVAPELSKNQSCIHGLLDFFQTKFMHTIVDSKVVKKKSNRDAKSAMSLELNAVDVSVCFGYKWDSMQHQVDANWNVSQEEKWLGLDSSKLCGTDTNPCNGFELYACWHKLREGSYVDTAVHSTLTTLNAPEWKLLPIFETIANTELAWTRRVVDLLGCYKQAKQLGNEIFVSEIAIITDEARQAAALQIDQDKVIPRLSEAIPGTRAAAIIGTTIGAIAQRLVQAAGFRYADCSKIDNIVEFLFKDKLECEQASSPMMDHVPYNALPAILAVHMTELHSISAMSLLWVQFVKKIRQYWDDGKLLPRMGNNPLSTPNLRSCLLYQKLQMINFCIASLPINTQPSTSNDEDEFFDSVDVQCHTTTSPNATPLGRKAKLEDQTLLADAEDNALYEPILQPQVPNTIDNVLQTETIVKKLGSTTEAKCMRMQLQTQQLRSEMEAFKSANPMAQFGDYVRWRHHDYWVSWSDASTMDIDEARERKLDTPNFWQDVGFLSASICQEGHPLFVLWQATIPKPICDQKPLFNPAKEGEKAFHYLETIAPHELFRQLLVSMFSTSSVVLKNAVKNPTYKIDYLVEKLPLVEETIKHAISSLNEAYIASTEINMDDANSQSRYSVAYDMAISKIGNAVDAFACTEESISQAWGLLEYFPKHTSLVNRLMLVKDVHSLGCIIQEDERDLVVQVRNLCKTTQPEETHDPGIDESTRTFGTPTTRQYILSSIGYRHYNAPYVNFTDNADEMVPIVNRLFASFDGETVRFGVAQGESE